MQDRQQGQRPPGGTILGGASGGFSYEGARHDALAREDAALKREAGQTRDLPARKAAPAKPKPAKR